MESHQQISYFEGNIIIAICKAAHRFPGSSWKVQSSSVASMAELVTALCIHLRCSSWPSETIPFTIAGIQSIAFDNVIALKRLLL